VVDVVLGASVVLVLVLVLELVLVFALVLVSSGIVSSVVAGATCDFAEPPSADEQAASVNASPIATLLRPRGRISFPIITFDSVRPAIVPHFFRLGRRTLKVEP